jgi:copper chaperone CopZ
MLVENEAKWGDKVRLIGLSIDNEAVTVKNHVEKKGWTKVEHYHVRTPGCSADKDYGVNGVPHVLLVDTTGKIVFVGHPASRNIEEDINTLLRGENLTGEGTQSNSNEENKTEDGNSDERKINQAKADFIKDSKKFMEDHGDECKKIGRGFVVLVDESSYNVKTKKFSHDTTCITQLMGPEEVITSLKEKVDKWNKNECWKNKDTLKPI